MAEKPMKGRCYGVTGTRHPSSDARQSVIDWVNSLPRGSTLYHGGCIGVDAIAAKFAWQRHLTVIGVLPANHTMIAHGAWKEWSHFIIHAPPGRGNTNDYRARNELLVYQLKMEGGLLKAFWTGSQRSGTKMTINIAERANVPVDIERITS